MTHLTRLTVLGVVLLGAASYASAETILINFGGIDASPDETTSDGSLTNWTEAVKNGTQSTVVDSDGNTLAGVSVATADMGGFPFDNSAGDYASGGSVPSWLDTDAIEIPWYNQGDGGSVTISGLTAPAYQVDLIAARSTAGSGPDRINDYYANGSLSDGDASLDWSSYVDGWVAGGVMTWSSVTPDAGGVITMTDGDNTNSHWTAMRLTAIPEPATMALLGLGGLAMLRRRKA